MTFLEGTTLYSASLLKELEDMCSCIFHTTFWCAPSSFHIEFYIHFMLLFGNWFLVFHTVNLHTQSRMQQFILMAVWSVLGLPSKKIDYLQKNHNISAYSFKHIDLHFIFPLCSFDLLFQFKFWLSSILNLFKTS